MKKAKVEKIRIDKLSHEIRDEANAVNDAIEFIHAHGNINRRKKHKLTKARYDNVRNHLFEYPVRLRVAMDIINANKKLKKEFNSLLKGINNKMLSSLLEEEEGKK